ncbi:Endoribonuclease YbeY [Sedimentisphaera cyanobacteriorum]|uniref:Endoribonuclease YbeY n=1 Tax=Sedimentisphaera cyanobacteriorum TaxID=1940790 RepID=A0A1Q2HQP8_9BACT|nr:rRNA maturation RNase YbeY [Sedimentisphaera cyanobacteriorum]AQQ09565.1 Endoribonuclease YbeY [Sedimentisphaera cyanobacteriorum]
MRNLTEFACERLELEDAFISIAVVGDEAVSEVHRLFMADDKTTDVISFDLTEPEGGEVNFEIIVNYQMAARTAEDMPHSAEDELMLYLLHGLLHNLGFDDTTEEAFHKMHKEEDDILEEFGVGRIFGERKFEPKG